MYHKHLKNMNCYICLQSIENPKKVCGCDPTNYPVHDTCMLNWTASSQKTTCQICTTPYNLEAITTREFEEHKVRQCVSDIIKNVTTSGIIAFVIFPDFMGRINDPQRPGEIIRATTRVLIGDHVPIQYFYNDIDQNMLVETIWIEDPEYIVVRYHIKIDPSIAAFLTPVIDGFTIECQRSSNTVYGTMKSILPISDPSFPWKSVRGLQYDKFIPFAKKVIQELIRGYMMTDAACPVHRDDYISLSHPSDGVFDVVVAKYIPPVIKGWPFPTEYTPDEIEGYDMTHRFDQDTKKFHIRYVKK